MSAGNFTVSLVGVLSGGVATSPQEGDYVIVIFANGDTVNRNMRATDLSWAQLVDAYVSDTYDVNLGVFAKFMGPTPDTEFEGSTTSASSPASAVVVHVWRGVDTGTPMDASAVARPQSNTNVIDANSITTVTDGAVVLITGGGVNFGDPYTVPSGMENFFYAVDGTSYVRAVVASALVETAGAYNPDAVGGGVSNNLISYTVSTLALRPA
jgi:hypothetical protein